MITKRAAGERGHADHGWLDTRHTFSFASYHDPRHMGFGSLRVINDDRVAPGAGFGTHGHRDMEIVSYVVEGALEHRDSMGNGSVLRPGDVQRMTAGTGITHSEFNGSKEDSLRFLQIWVVPNREGLEPGWEEKHYPAAERHNRLRLVVSPDGSEGSLRIHQDVRVYAGLLDGDASVDHPLQIGRRAWVQVVNGQIEVNGQSLLEGDGLALTGETGLRFRDAREAEFLVFDLA
jgi:redox-sensitive bicupin YhaK (pirin superfamily)